LKGKEYFLPNGEINFPSGVPLKDFMKRNIYRTVFGPSVSSEALIYQDDNVNLVHGLRRLTCIRKPECPGLEQVLRALQGKFLQSHQNIFILYRRLLEPHFEGYQDAFIEALQHHADPHVKRALRIAGFQELIESGQFNWKGWVDRVAMKAKKDEIAKHGKKMRIIVDLGVVASLLGFRLTSFMKEAQSKATFIHAGCEFIFCKAPSYSMMREVFDKLLHPRHRATFVFFSDDSCFSVRHPSGRVDMYNVDISDCDKSHTKALFDVYRSLFPEKMQEDVDGCIAQCMMPITVRSDSGKRLEKVILKPREPILYSGSTLTTSLNNVASLTIGIALAESLDLSEAGLKFAAATAGYIVTMEKCEIDEDLQFLKTSPAYDVDGNMQPVLNAGVFFRSSGMCHGDLPGKGPLQPRARDFQAALIQGMFPRVHSPLISHLRQSTGVTTPSEAATKMVQKDLEYKVERAEDDPILKFSDSALLKRYRLHGYEVMELHEFADLSFEQRSGGSALHKVLMKDYSLPVHH
jgi:hypothetical protein